jgi:cytochrome c553
MLRTMRWDVCAIAWPKGGLAVLMLAACLCLAAAEAGAQPRTPPRVVSACAPCHGTDGIGRDVEIPNIAGQHSIYLRKQLLAFRNGVRKHPEMQYMARELSQRELDALVTYYSLLPSP